MDPIKQKIQSLCPHVMERHECECQWCGMRKHNGGGGHDIIGYPITLAVVLRAIGKMQPANKTLVTLECDGQFVLTSFPSNFEEKRALGPTWNLSKDNYDEQTEETRRFIGNLLGV